MAERPPKPEKDVGITQWRIAGAHVITTDQIETSSGLVQPIDARGQVLIGPHELGAQAVAPPGVWTNTPPNAAERMTNSGWRHGVWRNLTREQILEAKDKYDIPHLTGDEKGLVWIRGEERPIWLKPLLLSEVAGLLESEAPEHLEFIKQVVARNLRVLIGMTRPDSCGNYSPRREAA